MNSDYQNHCQVDEDASSSPDLKKELEKIRNLLQIQIRLLHESNQEVEYLKKENNIMKSTISNLEELKSKTIFENEQLRKKLTEFDQYLEIKEKHQKATELIAELWIENQKLKDIIQKNQ